MTYRIEYTTAAARQLRKLDRPIQRQLVDAIDALADEPRPNGCLRLTGREGWRIRVGRYRVLYDISDGRLTVTVIRLGHRRDVYGA